MMNADQCWGRFKRVEQKVARYRWRSERPFEISDEDGTFLPVGNRRSYGDVCMNEGGVVLDCLGLDRFVGFDSENGVLACEAGVLLSDILELTVPAGWFVPVTPGTRFVTVGGAIANDVHGKNHHRAGTFGCHVRRFELVRSDGSSMICSPDQNEDYFRATIGGLGLTGLIAWAEIDLKKIDNPYIEQEIVKYKNIDEFFRLSEESDESHEYTVAWIDCLAKGSGLGKGLYIRGNHARKCEGKIPAGRKNKLVFSVDPPFALISKPSLKLFNTLYYNKQRLQRTSDLVHYEPFFYPLDAIISWNRIYGSNGFFQYQCAVPESDAAEAIRRMLKLISESGAGSFLAVLKMFGGKKSPGLLSFPCPGATLALDFPNSGRKIDMLLEKLDEVTLKYGGRVNPSKDARMSPDNFKQYYPGWEDLGYFIDPKISSSFWRRVTR